MTDIDDLNDSIDIEIRSANSVANRCIILSAMARRMVLGSGLLADDAGEALALAFDLREWIRVEGLWNDLTPREAALIQNGVEHRVPGAVEEATHTSEVVATLCWAMGLNETLAEGPSDNLVTLLALVPSPWQKSSSWVSRQILRPDEQIIQIRERSESWEWRLTVEPERRDLRGSQLRQLEKTILTVAQDGHSSGYLSHAGDRAFAIDAVPVSTMTIEDVEVYRSIAISRLKTLNWVCGFGDDWESVPLDV